MATVKQPLVEEYKKKLDASCGVILANYCGLGANEINVLRRELHENAVELQVVKNTIFRIAIQDSGFRGLNDYLEGPVAAVFISEDPVAASKILSKFHEEHKSLEIKGGLVEGRALDAKALEALAKIAPRPQLLVQLCTTLQAPIYQLAGVLNGLLLQFVYTLQAISQRKVK